MDGNLFWVRVMRAVEGDGLDGGEVPAMLVKLVLSESLPLDVRRRFLFWEEKRKKKKRRSRRGICSLLEGLGFGRVLA